jgi:hypothetical protein
LKTVAIFFPQIIPNKQNEQLKTTYIIPIAYRFPSNKFSDSSEKVENVVKPPHKPVFKNNFEASDIPCVSSEIPTIIPITTAPSTFVISVNIGNKDLKGIKLIEYLSIAPNPPPSATYIKSIYPP